MKEQKISNTIKESSGFSRRDFLSLSKNMLIGTGIAGLTPGLIWLDNAIAAIPASEGYLLVDTKKCQGCVSCMLACSLVHEGVQNLTLSRIQVIQNPFESFPDDVTVEQCRQCVDPACVKACPVDALKANAKYGNVRMVDRTKCIGCGDCAEACPYMPSMAVICDEKSRKCDLCANTPYHWDDAGGGPNGKQACVEVCPVGAIKFTKKIPVQEGDNGYKVNLRTKNWWKLGYPRG
jgi:protein NrfC